MKNIQILLADYWREILLGSLSAVILIGLLWFRLGSLTFGQAADIEIATRDAAGSLRAIFDNPLNAPYTLLQQIMQLFGQTSLTSLRLVSTFFAALSAILFYFVARQWHSDRVALLATWLFASSAWFLHVGRLASPEVLWLVGMLALVMVLAPNRNGRHTSWALPSVLAVLAALMYIPGMVWLVVIGSIWQRKNLRDAWRATEAGWQRFLSIGVLIGLLVPLGQALLRTPDLIRSWLAISQPLAEPVTIARQFIALPENLVLRSWFDPVHWLGNLPVLSSFEIIMLILGIYFYASHLKAARTKLIAVLSLVCWALIAIGSIVNLTVILPVVYLLVAAGIAYILHKWLKVFPNNPLARSFGIGIVMLAILLTSVYQTRSYFVAWRYNDETGKAFTQQL